MVCYQRTGWHWRPSENKTGLNKRAREDGWEKRRRKGVQGRGVEYSLHSLPGPVKQSLLQESESPDYAPLQPASQAIWMQIYHQLSDKERDDLIAYVLRVGVSTMLCQLGLTVTEAQSDAPTDVE